MKLPLYYIYAGLIRKHLSPSRRFRKSEIGRLYVYISYNMAATWTSYPQLHQFRDQKANNGFLRRLRTDRLHHCSFSIHHCSLSMPDHCSLPQCHIELADDRRIFHGVGSEKINPASEARWLGSCAASSASDWPSRLGGKRISRF
jgi:hypothetical protein